MNKILVLQGPNLNLLGKREPGVYGTMTLEKIHERLREEARDIGIDILFFQTNHEGEMIDRIHAAGDEEVEGLIINPGAFTHYSYAIRDAIASVNIPAIEVHISNIYAREDFRKNSVIAPITLGQISGLGVHGYSAAVHVFHRMGKET